MTILNWLGFGPESDAALGDTESVRRIARRLEALPPERARFVACLAYVLGRAALADREVTTEEQRRMATILREVGELPEEQAALAADIAAHMNRRLGGTENFLVTRELAQVASREERGHVLDCLFSVAAADGAITGPEEAQLRQIASELGFSHREYVTARLAWSKMRSVLRDAGPARGGDGEDAG